MAARQLRSWHEVGLREQINEPPELLLGKRPAASAAVAPVGEPSALHETSDRCDPLIEGLGLITYLAQNNGRRSMRSIGRKIESLLGHPVEEWLRDTDLFVKLLHPDDRTRVLSELVATRRGCEPVLSEYRLVARDGRVVWVRDASVLDVDVDGVEVVRGYLLDLTELKQAVEGLQRSEGRFRQLAEDIPTIVYVLEPDEVGTVSYLSPQIVEVLGYPLDAYNEPSFFLDRVLHPEDRDAVLADIARNNAGERTVSVYRCMAADGRIVWFEDYAVPCLDERGRVVEVRGFMLDVTEKKLSEDRLAEAEERYRRLVEELPLVTYLSAANDLSSLEYMSPQIEEMLGYPVEKWTSDPEFFLNTVHPDDREQVVGEIQQNIAGVAMTSRYRMIASDGREVWVEDVSIPELDADGRVTAVRGFLMDVTERVRIEQEQRAAEERYRSLAEEIPAVIYVGKSDALGTVTYISPRIVDILGYPLESWGDPVFFLDSVLHPDDRDTLLAAIARNVAGEPSACTYRCRAADGRIVWFYDEAIPHFDERGQVAEVRGCMIDITEEKRAQELHAEAERRFQQFVERLPLVVYSDRADELCTSTYVSPQVTTLLGYMPEEWLARPELFHEILHPDDRERVLAEHAEWHARGGGYQSEYRLIARDGRTVWVRDQAVIVDDPASSERRAEGFWLDITERKRAEQDLRKRDEQLFQAQKMEAIGRLAGGVAHDFNNLLTIIRGYVDFLLSDASLGPSTHSSLLEIDVATDRAVALTRQLLAFSRRQVLEPANLDLSKVLAELHSMLRRLIGEDIELEIRSEPSLPVVRADHSQIVQVLMNLAVNARDAMPRGGRLTIEARNVLAQGDGEGTDATQSRYVALIVSDTGVGMDDATLKRAFEPFFTTKEQGKGTGLGLATVKEIVTQNRGRVEVESTLGRGTTFTILLPAVEGRHDSHEESPDPESQGRGTETILVVEDDPNVRRLIRAALIRAGYAVLEAAGAAEALALVHDAARFDLLLTDVVMPGMSGRALAEEVALIRPGVPVLYMSGYADDDILHHGVQRSEMAFIQKPFLPAALAAKVRTVLDARRDEARAAA